MSSDRDPRKSAESGRLAGSGLRSVALLSTAGLTLALSVGIGVGIGVYLDRQFKTNYLVIVFALLGSIAGFRELIRAVARANEEEERAEAAEKQRRLAPQDHPEIGGHPAGSKSEFHGSENEEK